MALKLEKQRDQNWHVIAMVLTNQPITVKIT